MKERPEKLQKTGERRESQIGMLESKIKKNIHNSLREDMYINSNLLTLSNLVQQMQDFPQNPSPKFNPFDNV